MSESAMLDFAPTPRPAEHVGDPDGGFRDDADPP